ncbi:MAG: hypothetical protein KC457_17055 [Myxococcales bacterium]|nr:hypothetical protein [Myxococcales bacterium]
MPLALPPPDVADVSAPIRFERPAASRGLRAGLVLAWTLLLLLVVDLPLWLSADGRLGELATINHHLVLADGWAFVPRGHPIADFIGVGTLRRFYLEAHHAWPLRTLGVAVMGLMTGLGLQQLLSEIQGRLGRRREQLAIFAWLMAAVVLIRLWLLFLPLAATWIPAAAMLVPVMVQLGRRVCLACGFGLAVAAAMMVPPFDAVLGLTIGAQATAIAFCTPRHRGAGWRWAPPFMLACAGATFAVYLATQLLSAGTLHVFDLSSLEWGRLGGACIAGMIWPLVGLAIDPLFERAAGNLSRSLLLELSDLNNPVLQRI